MQLTRKCRNSKVEPSLLGPLLPERTLMATVMAPTWPEPLAVKPMAWLRKPPSVESRFLVTKAAAITPAFLPVWTMLSKTLDNDPAPRASSPT